MPALLALVLVTAVWGVTFVQVKDAVALYPLFAFLAVRFCIATLTLAAPGLPRVAEPRAAGIRRRGVPRPAAGRRVHAADGWARADDRLEHGLHHRDVRRPDAADRPRPRQVAHRPVGVGRSCAVDDRARDAFGHPCRLGDRRPPGAGSRRRLLPADRPDGALRPALRRRRLHVRRDACCRGRARRRCCGAR